jgi:primosomal protein N' (replication factor Y)
MDKPSVFLRIALPTPLRRLFDYRAPADMNAETFAHLQVGTRIAVNFANRPMVGILWDKVAQTDVPMDKLKAIDEVLDEQACVPQPSLQFFQWAADYYHHSLGDVIQNALPAWLRQRERKDLNSQLGYELTELGCNTESNALKSAKKQANLLIFFQQQTEACTEEDLINHGFSRQIINGLLEKNLIATCRLPINYAHKVNLGEKLSLNEEQKNALATITSGNHCTLLAGITGSGKTEVYLQAIEDVIQAGKQALILVPEIGLTPQTVSRFEERFGNCVRMLHSACSDGERLATWFAARDGKASIIIGTRSAIFIPMANPGIIIIDEEHDASFKQQDGFRYSARDLAVVRGILETIPVVLGSATPSLESLANVQQGRYQIAKLNQRAGLAQPPAMETIDVHLTTVLAKQALQPLNVV